MRKGKENNDVPETDAKRKYDKEIEKESAKREREAETAKREGERGTKIKMVYKQ